MRLRIPLLSLACALLAAAAVASAVAALARPNFTGTWELDQSKSHSVPKDMKQTMTVVHEGDKVSVETKSITAQGERVLKEDYTLDGKQSEFTPPRPPQAPADAPPPKGKRSGRWMPNDKGFILEEEIINQTPKGEQTILVARKWMTWPDGTLSIEVITERPDGTFNNKRVFVKK